MGGNLTYPSIATGMALAAADNSRPTGEAGEIGTAQDPFILVLSGVGWDFAVRRIEELHASTAENAKEFSEGDRVAHPVQERRITVLSLHVDGFISPEWIHNDGLYKRAIRSAKPGIAIRIPLHQGADGIAITEINVIVNVNLVVVKNGRASKRKEQTI